jgi:hypothetical protein
VLPRRLPAAYRQHDEPAAGQEGVRCGPCVFPDGQTERFEARRRLGPSGATGDTGGGIAAVDAAAPLPRRCAARDCARQVVGRRAPRRTRSAMTCFVVLDHGRQVGADGGPREAGDDARRAPHRAGVERAGAAPAGDRR